MMSDDTKRDMYYLLTKLDLQLQGHDTDHPQIQRYLELKCPMFERPIGTSPMEHYRKYGTEVF